MFQAELKDFGAQSCNLVALVDLDAFGCRHGDAIRWEPFWELLVAQRANVGDSFSELPLWDGDVPGFAKSAARRGTVNISDVATTQQLPNLLLPLLRAEIDAEVRDLGLVAVSLPVDWLD